MNELMQTGIELTSLDIAELTGKNHQHVMRDIRKEIENLGEEIGQSIFGQSSYKNSQNKEMPCYKFGKDGAMQLALKYDAMTRYKVIKRIEELEAQSKPQLPTTYKEALLQLVAQVEENEKLQTENLVLVQQNNELQPKASYYDIVLQNNSTLAITLIAKDYGMSGMALNKLLHELGVQYKKSDTWFLYSKYQSCGYTHTETKVFNEGEPNEFVKVYTKWTQKGRLFIYDLLKANGTLPMIEREETEETA